MFIQAKAKQKALIKVLMVEHIQNNLHQIIEEQRRWKQIIGVQWNKYRLGYSYRYALEVRHRV